MKTHRRTQESLTPASRTELSKWITPAGKPLQFQAAGQSAGTLVPFYQMGFGVPYCMYFDLEA
jgi:hypothetical protein